MERSRLFGLALFASLSVFGLVALPSYRSVVPFSIMLAFSAHASFIALCKAMPGRFIFYDAHSTFVDWTWTTFTACLGSACLHFASITSQPNAFLQACVHGMLCVLIGERGGEDAIDSGTSRSRAIPCPTGQPMGAALLSNVVILPLHLALYYRAEVILRANMTILQFAFW